MRVAQIQLSLTYEPILSLANIMEAYIDLLSVVVVLQQTILDVFYTVSTNSCRTGGAGMVYSLNEDCVYQPKISSSAISMLVYTSFTHNCIVLRPG